MKLIVFSLLLAYAMAVPAPEANPEAAPEAEADPAVLYSYSYGKPATYAYYAPYYYGYGLGYYGGHGLGYYGHYLGKRSAEPQPEPEFQPQGFARQPREFTSELQARSAMEGYGEPRYARRMAMPDQHMRYRREAEPAAAPEAAPEAGPEAEAEAEAAAKAWYYAYGYGHGYPYYGYGYGRYYGGYYGYRGYGGYYYGK